MDYKWKEEFQKEEILEDKEFMLQPQFKLSLQIFFYSFFVKKNFFLWFIFKNVNLISFLSCKFKHSTREENETGWGVAHILCFLVSITFHTEDLPMQEIQFRSLGWEDPLEKRMVTHSSILAWRIPWTEPGGLQFMGSRRVGHDRETHTFCLMMDIVFVDYEGSLLPHFISIPLDIHQSKYVISKYTRCSEINHLVKRKSYGPPSCSSG